MRSDYVIKNSFWSVGGNILKILFGFISRTLFIHILSAEYLGINGLFTDVLSLLSLAELGFSSAVTYNLYLPIREKNEKRIAGIMNFYRLIYRIVALVILIGGIGLMPFLKYIIKETAFDISYLRIAYFIFLIKTVSTYFYSYNYTLAVADQKNYYISRFAVIVTPAISLLKIITLLIASRLYSPEISFLLYTIVEILAAFAFNIMKAKYVISKYPVLTNTKEKLEKQERKSILTDVKNIFIGRVSTTILTSTDSIIIARFVDVITLGYISSYNVLIGYVQGFINVSLNTMQASIGNMIATEKKEYSRQIMDKLTLITMFVACFACTSLFCLSSDFIRLFWGGESYVMDNFVVFVLMLNCFMQIIKMILWMTLGVCGFFDKDKYISLIGALMNIVVSIILVIKIGVVGVILGTIISQTVQFILKDILLFRRYFNQSPLQYGLLVLQCFATYFLELAATYGVCTLVNVISNTYILFIAKMIICVIVPNTITFLLYRKSEAFQYLVSTVKRTINTKIFKKRVKEGN